MQLLIELLIIIIIDRIFTFMKVLSITDRNDIISLLTELTFIDKYKYKNWHWLALLTIIDRNDIYFIEESVYILPRNKL